MSEPIVGRINTLVMGEGRFAPFKPVSHKVTEESKYIARSAVEETEQMVCDKHVATTGTRFGCMICALDAMSTALSKIGYACEKPNEMEVSAYDVHCDEAEVVKQVQELRRQRDELYAIVFKSGRLWTESQRELKERIEDTK